MLKELHEKYNITPLGFDEDSELEDYKDGYRREYALVAFEIIARGGTYLDVLDELGISAKTFDIWMDRHTDFNVNVNLAYEFKEKHFTDIVEHAVRHGVVHPKLLQFIAKSKYGIGEKSKEEDNEPKFHLEICSFET